MKIFGTNQKRYLCCNMCSDKKLKGQWHGQSHWNQKADETQTNTGRWGYMSLTVICIVRQHLHPGDGIQPAQASTEAGGCIHIHCQVETLLRAGVWERGKINRQLHTDTQPCWAWVTHPEHTHSAMCTLRVNVKTQTLGCGSHCVAEAIFLCQCCLH